MDSEKFWSAHFNICEQSESMEDEENDSFSFEGEPVANKTLGIKTFDYHDICDNLINYPELYSEYSEEYHGYCVNIILNYEERDLLREYGQVIFNKGGTEAMRACFYIIKCFILNNSPYQSCIPSEINIGWDGIGEWKM